VKSATERIKRQDLQIMCDEIIEFEGAGSYDVKGTELASTS